jgi:hypothetical protein
MDPHLASNQLPSTAADRTWFRLRMIEGMIEGKIEVGNVLIPAQSEQRRTPASEGKLGVRY